LAIFFIHKKYPWAWLFAAVPNLWILFNPTKDLRLHYSIGLIPAIFQAIGYQDPMTIVVLVVKSIVPILIISYSIYYLIAGLINFENIKLEIILGIIFALFASLQISDIARIIIVSGLTKALNLQSLIILVLYVGILILWGSQTKVSPQK
jgi:hypothetical protein